MKIERLLILMSCLVLIRVVAPGQVNEGFNGTTFPPTGWTTSASSGTVHWNRIASNTRNASAGTASSLNPASGVSKHLTISMDVSSSTTTITYYVSVSSITAGTGATLTVGAGTDATSMTVLRTINLEDAGVFTANTYVQFTDNIDGTTASGQTGAVDLRSTNPGYVRWSHQKTAGSGASCRLEDVVVSNASPLPVQLRTLSIVSDHFAAELRWSTATETNNYGFEIERSDVNNQLSATNWQKVGFVVGSGTSSSPREYSYTDKGLPSGRHAYRIKQIDNDGTFEYFGNAEVEIGLAAKVFKLESNYPNPFNPSTSIEFTVGTYGHTSLRVYNMLGQEVATLFNGEAEAGRIYQVRFDASKLPSGLYFAKLEAGKQQMMRKLVLMK